MLRDAADKQSSGKLQDEVWNAFLTSIIDGNQSEATERKQNRSKKREQEILRAALRVFARDGISRARIGDIAAEAAHVGILHL